MPKQEITDRVDDRLLKKFFPKNDWLPTITTDITNAYGDRSEVTATLLFGACERCGSPIESRSWRKHINWHRGRH